MLLGLFFNKMRFFLTGISIGIIYWTGDSIIDTYVFHSGDFPSAMFYPEAEEIWNRLLVIIFMIIVGAVYTNIGTANFRREILRLKETDEKLKQNNSLLRTVIEGTTDAIYVKDLQDRYLLINSAGARTFGKSVEDILGKDNTELLFSDAAREIKEANRRIMETGQTQESENLITVAGVNRIFLSTKGPYRDSEGKIIGVIGVSRDITERKLAEEKIKSEYAFRKAIEDSLMTGVAAADLNGRIIYANPAFCEMVGWKEGDLLGSIPPYLFWPPEEIETIRDAFQIRLSGKGPREIEYCFLRKNGERFPVGVLGSPLMDGNGKKIGILSSFHDLTEKRKMEEELLKIQKLESLGVLAGGIAHDFNNILTGILGNISLAKLGLDPKDRLFTRLSEAEKGSLRATELARQLLTFAKGGAPVKRAASMADIIDHSVQFALRGSNVKSQFFLQSGLWSVEVDEGQISQVIHNLVINAQQAMPQGGIIQIFAENLTVESDDENGLPVKKGNYVKVSIKDFGIGISKDHFSKIFDPYFTTKQKGSGLGLSISFSIIQKHNGYLTVESKPGAGTVFHIFLPASFQVLTPQQEDDTLQTGRGRVLVMDDEESVRDVVRVMLERLGYEVDLACGGTEALLLYGKTGLSYDAVIADLTMPGDMGGVEVLKRLREIDPHIKVIVSSGYSNDPVLADFKAYGFSDVIIKPYSIKDLGRTLHRVISGEEGHQQF